jgi:hypothetical protein
MLSVLAASLLLAAGPDLEGGFAAGGAWDSNVYGDRAGAVAAGYASARGWAAARFDATPRDELRLELALSGLTSAAVPDLDRLRAAVGASWWRAHGERLATRLALHLAARDHAGDALDGWDGGLRASARLALRAPFALHGAASFTHRAAADPLFGWDVTRAELGLEVELWRRAFALVRYGLDVGRGAFAADANGLATAGAVTRLAHGLVVELEQGLPGGTFLAAWYGLTAARDPARTFLAQAAGSELGWRW